MYGEQKQAVTVGFGRAVDQIATEIQHPPTPGGAGVEVKDCCNIKIKFVDDRGVNKSGQSEDATAPEKAN